ncbi:hypothetical protein Hamer_G022292, partial [Homarus americanus]
SQTILIQSRTEVRHYVVMRKRRRGDGKEEERGGEVVERGRGEVVERGGEERHRKEGRKEGRQGGRRLFNTPVSAGARTWKVRRVSVVTKRITDAGVICNTLSHSDRGRKTMPGRPQRKGFLAPLLHRCYATSLRKLKALEMNRFERLLVLM